MINISTRTLLFLSVTFFAWSCSEIILEKNISGKSVELITPPDGSTLTSLTPSFWWEEVEGARNYQIQVVSPSFDKPTRLFVDSTIAKNRFSIDLDTLQFQWRVRAINGGYQTEFATATFKIDSGSVIADRALKLISPADNSFHKNKELELKWEKADDVEKYNLVVEGDTTIDQNYPAAVTSVKIVAGSNKTYIWKVIPINARHYKQSSISKFTIDNTNPTIPSLTEPSENAFISQESVIFRWESGDENLEKNYLIVFTEGGAAIHLTKDAGTNNTISVPKSELGNSGDKRQWAVKSVDKAGNESSSSKRSFSIQ